MLALKQTGRYFQLALRKGIGAHYKFSAPAYDGTTGEVVDDSGLGNHGTAVNGATTTPDGKLGRGLQLVAASDQYVSLGMTELLDGATSFTFIACVSANVLPFTAHRGIYARGNNAQRTPWIWGFSGTNRLRMQFETDMGGEGDADVQTPDLTQGQKHLVVITWDGTTVTPYLDAVAGATDTTAFSQLAVADMEDSIGYIDTFGYWDGMIDEVAVLRNQVLDGDQIALYKSLMDAGMDPLARCSLPMDLRDIRPELEVVEV